jgi:NAD(P)H dehydrogenase (quinone)
MVATADIGRTAAALLQQSWSGVRLVELEGPRRYSGSDSDIAGGPGAQVIVRTILKRAWPDIIRA